MYNSISFYCFIAFLNCNLKNVFSEETIPLRPNFTGKYTSGITNYEVVIPQRVNEDGSLISHVVSHRHSKRSTKELEFIFYKIPIGGKDYLIELTPNRKLISPGAVIEIHKENVRKSANRKSLNASSNNETIGEMFRNLDIRKLKNTDCYFSGTVKGENVSKAALSTCFGLAGFIQISKGFYTIEPVAEHDPLLEDAYPHILYKTDELDNSSVCHAMGQPSASLVRKRRESNAGLSLPLYVETLIVMDKTLTSHHPESDCENYILTVFNMADNLFHDASLGLMMSLTVVRMIRLEAENDEMNLQVNRNAEKTLKYFQNWQYEMNPGDDTHPNHHDVALLVTKVNVCNSKSACGLLGLTTIGKACDPKLSAALCEDNGLRLGHVIAHEIGHLLGADHDSDNSTSNGTDANGLKTVMHPDISTTARTWSSSSQAYFKAFLRSGMGNCLLDEPEEHHFNVQDLLPGVMYNADFQCKNLITDRARECDMGSNCESLNCFVPGYACIVTHTPPVDGTFCGENMWCHNTKCLVVGERPGAIDGNWGEWSAWSDCSRTCGSGVASSVRNCDKPQPSHGGKNCVGERKRYKICAAMKIWECMGNYNLRNLLRITTVPQNISDLIRFISEEVNVSFVGKPCETGRPSFRDIQCGEFNDWIYPEDGKLHTWMAYFSHDDNPCILYCVNEEKQVAALKPRVVDGTMCFRGIRDICVGGICKSLPCDLHFESNAVEDACGVCHGDGTGCEFSEGTETLSKFTKGLTKLVNIPSGTRNIKVEELSPTLAKIIVKDKDTREMYVRGSLGMFTVPGSQAWLGMIKKNQAALNIPGPVSKPLSIWIQRLDNVTVKWSMALPAEQQRKPEFAWDFLRWGPCSAKCGPGTQISKPSCMEGKAGLVEDTFCADLEMPPTKVRQCEVTKCEPRWMVGDWKGCVQSNSKKQERKRIVYCIKPVGEGEGESQIVSDSQCAGPKPHESEPCDKRMKRKRNLYINSNPPENNDSPFVSDTSENDFRNKYKDYLRRFGVPQKYSQTVRPNLTFSPHFKHYFHLLENLPSGTRYEAQAQYDVSPDFYKTFSRRQAGHNQPNFQKSIRSLRKGSKKSLDWEYRQTHRKHFNYPERHSNWLLQLRHNRTASVVGIRDIEHVLILKQRYKKAYNYPSLNLIITANPNKSDRSRFVNFIRKCRANEMSGDEMTKQKRLRLKNVLNFKYYDKEKRNMNHFLLFSKIRAEPKSSETFECNEIRKLINNHDKEIDENTAKLYEKVKNSYKGNQIHKELTSSKCDDSLKSKRASLIWKKPKSKDGNLKTVKEQTGNGGGSESKNYLNNLFRDNHPKPTPSNKPQEIQTKFQKPVIKEGVLVLDKDSPENQEMEILFDGEETEGKRRKFGKLPQLTRNERKIMIRGQDVFNLFQEIQDQEENSAFYRLQTNPKEKLDINVKVPEGTTKAEGTETTTSTTTTTTSTTTTTAATTTTTTPATTTKTTAATTTTTPTTTTAATTKATIKTTEGTKAPEKSSETTKEKQDEEKPSTNKPEDTKEKQHEEKSSTNKPESTKEQKSSTDKPENTKETKKEEESTKQDGSKEIKTVLETLVTEKPPDSGTTKSDSGDDSEGEECDVDEEILDDSQTSDKTDKEKKTEEKEDKKEKKKKKKEKEKEKKEKEKEKKEKEKKKKEGKKNKEEKNKKEGKKKKKESKKKKQEKKKKKQELEDSDLDWVDLVWAGFPRNQEEKLTADGDDIDDEIEKYLKCTERQKSGEQERKASKEEEKERRREEKRRRKEEKRKQKEEEKEEKEKEREMKKKMQTEELLNEELKMTNFIWTGLPDIDHFITDQIESNKYDQQKQIPENYGGKWPDRSVPNKEEMRKYNQRKLLPENQEVKLSDTSDSGKVEIEQFNQRKLLPENQRANLTINPSANDDISKYLRSAKKKKKKQWKKEEKIIKKERKEEERKRIEEGKKLKKIIRMKTAKEKHKALQNRNKPNKKTSNLANSNTQWVYITRTGLPQDQKEKLTERLDSGKEETDNCDQTKPTTEKPEVVLSSNECVNSKISKHLRRLEKKCKKKRLREQKKFQKQKEEEERMKLEEGKRLKKILIKKGKLTRQKLLQKKVNPPKRKNLGVINTTANWEDLVKAAFPMNQEVMLTDHLDIDKEGIGEHQHGQKLLPKNPDDNLTLEDITKGPDTKPKTESQKKKEKKDKEKKEKKEAKKRKEEGKRLKKILKRKRKLARKKEMRLMKMRLRGKKKHPHLVNSDSDLAYLIRSGSPKNQEENFTGMGCDFDDEMPKHLKAPKTTEKKKEVKVCDTNFGCDVDQQIAKYLKLAEKSKLEKETNPTALGCNLDHEIEKYLHCMKAKKRIGIEYDIDNRISTYLQCTGKSKKEKKKEEKEKKKMKKAEAKRKKKDEKQLKKEEKLIEKELKKKRKKEEKEEKLEEKKEEKMRKKKKKWKESTIDYTIIGWKNLQGTDFPDNQKEKLTADSDKQEKNKYNENQPKPKFHDGL